MSIRELLLILRHRLLQPLELSLLAISFISAVLLLWMLNLIPVIKNLYCTFHLYSPIPNSVLKFLFWLGLFHLIKTVTLFVVEKTKRRSKYSFESKNWKKEWIFNGQSYARSKPDRVVIRSSRAGCLLKKYLWKDFELEFEMKFLESASMKHTGIIFRAKDLENYFMLEVFKRDDDERIFVKPHVRTQGAWEFVQETPIGEFNLTDFIDFKLRLDGLKATLFISGKNVFEWDLPTHVDINHIEAGVSGLSDETTSRGIVPKIDFRNRYGMIGFRAYPGQGAEIKDLKIRK